MSVSPLSPATVPLREAAIDLNHWYVVASSRELTDRPLAVELWGHELVLYRDRGGRAIALEDRCPHRFVKLSDGQVQGDRLECVYHGWQFAADGTCAEVPYLAANQKLPPCRIPTYPVREQDGFIWLYPGEVPRDRPLPEPMALPEWDHLNYIASVATIDCRGHFSFLIENLMDMHHGRLHDDYQAWASAKLDRLEASGDRVDAHYTAQSYYRIDQIWSVAQLFIPALRQPHPEPLTVSYRYPHWSSSLGEEFRIYCLFCPVSRDRTRAYLVHFTSLEAFDNLHKLPIPFRRFIKNSLFNCAKGMLDGLVRQDVLMIEQEQTAYRDNPRRRGPELNPTLAAVQRLIRDRAPRPTPSP
ncbi:MAG: aromatic ring-hydroxylating dioxygenase subunit alpha [Cyanophyceae cyanobacterium]